MNNAAEHIEKHLDGEIDFDIVAQIARRRLANSIPLLYALSIHRF